MALNQQQIQCLSEITDDATQVCSEVEGQVTKACKKVLKK